MRGSCEKITIINNPIQSYTLHITVTLLPLHTAKTKNREKCQIILFYSRQGTRLETTLSTSTTCKVRWWGTTLTGLTAIYEVIIDETVAAGGAGGAASSSGDVRGRDVTSLSGVTASYEVVVHITRPSSLGTVGRCRRWRWGGRSSGTSSTVELFTRPACELRRPAKKIPQWGFLALSYKILSKIDARLFFKYLPQEKGPQRHSHRSSQLLPLHFLLQSELAQSQHHCWSCLCETWHDCYRQLWSDYLSDAFRGMISKLMVADNNDKRKNTNNILLVRIYEDFELSL